MRRSSTEATAAAEAETAATTLPPLQNTAGRQSSCAGLGKVERRISSAADSGAVVVEAMEQSSMDFPMRKEKQDRYKEMEKPLEAVELAAEVMKKS